MRTNKEGEEDETTKEEGKALNHLKIFRSSSTAAAAAEVAFEKLDQS